ncbi:MAG: hypothetical protein RLY30_957 [Pseudomonadota bacterium]
MHSFYTSDGARLAYTDEGEGLPLLCLAGLTRDSRDFDYLSHHLPDHVRLIRLDCRGRGRSSRTGPQTYTVAHEASDVIALLDHLQIERAAILGSSRGGLLAMVLGASHPDRVLGVCLNDVGPVIERNGLERIATYVGVSPAVNTLEEIVERLPRASPGFHGVPETRWAEEAVRHFDECDGHLQLTYDPDIRIALQSALEGPAHDLWPIFDACRTLPAALIRAEHSDILSRETADEMRRRRPDLLSVEVLNRGHVPFLDEPEAVGLIRLWIEQTRQRLNTAATQ